MTSFPSFQSTPKPSDTGKGFKPPTSKQLGAPYKKYDHTGNHTVGQCRKAFHKHLYEQLSPAHKHAFKYVMQQLDNTVKDLKVMLKEQKEEIKALKETISQLTTRSNSVQSEGSFPLSIVSIEPDEPDVLEQA